MPTFTGTWGKDRGFGWEPYEPFTVDGADIEKAMAKLRGLRPDGFVGAYVDVPGGEAAKAQRIVSLP